MKNAKYWGLFVLDGAGNGIRTRDFNLGNSPFHVDIIDANRFAGAES